MIGTDPNYGLPDQGGGEEMGAQGQGAAFILPDANPVLATIERNVITQRTQQADERKQKEQDFNNFMLNQPTAWARDYPSLNGATSDLLKTAQGIQARGGNINSPSDPDYYKFQQQRQSTNQAAQLSKEHEAAYLTDMKDVAQNPKKYTPESVQRLQAWADINNPFKRGPKPSLEAIDEFDPYKFKSGIEKDYGGKMIANDSAPYTDPRTGKVIIKRTTGLPEDLQNSASGEALANPKYHEFASLHFNAEPQETQQKYLKAGGNNPTMALLLYNRDNLMGALTKKGLELKESNPIPLKQEEFNANGGDSDEQVAENFVNRQQLLQNGDNSVLSPNPNAITDPKFGGKAFSSNAFIGIPMGDRYETLDGKPAKASTKNAKKVPDKTTIITRDPNGDIDVALESGKHIYYNGSNSGYDQFTKQVLANGDYSQKVKDLIDLKLRKKGIINSKTGKQDWSVGYSGTQHSTPPKSIGGGYNPNI